MPLSDEPTEPPNAPDRTRRLRAAGDRLLTVVGEWTAPGPERTEWSESSMSVLVGAVTAAAGFLFLAAMMVIWVARS
ncbi:hypothetical protein GCM10010112_46480 [Actinoplanes lobatus]|uniref:Uncharacterized protein n=1 Tax=Actinoplanes lobatus TaxID=113568 RepID=A0ABQ4ADA6_9ACTN|nr:hypothetical protein GCM10010112_46480 [Actinoplanes lobatus]GIE38980.1 hypothetical protein Alo02nite_18780 [Actinoplanes lobatus]